MNIRCVLALPLCLLFYSLNAQNILSEDFQNGIPGTWTLINIDGLTPDSTQTDFITAAWVEWNDPLEVTNSIAISTSKYLPPGQADDWLITPSITLGSNSILNWNALAFNAAADGYEVRISTSTLTVAAFLANAPLFSLSAENTTWTSRSADLTGYSNQTVYLAFRNNSNNKFILGIDDVVVFDCNTINADAGEIDTSTTTACSGFPELDLGLSPSYLNPTPTTTISGNTNDVPDWSPLVARPFADDGSCCWIVGGDTANPPYQIVGFQVTASGSYTVTQTPSGYDGLFYIYTDPLDLTINPPTTYLSGVDDQGVDVAETLSISLSQGQSYYLVSSGYLTTDFGSYTTSFSGPGSLLLQDPGTGDLPFDYNFVVTNSNGIIVSIGDDLTSTTTFPGSPGGDSYTVCGISYVSANLNLNSFIGQSYASLVSVVNSNSCADLTNDCHQVVIKSGGTVEAGVGDTLCAGGTVTLTASGGVSYVWSTGESTASIQVNPLFTTIYTVTATDNIGCTASDNVTVKIYASDGGKFTDVGTTLACEGDSVLNFSLDLEFFGNFFPTQTNLIIGNTVNYLTWDPLPGRPFADGTCCSGFNPVYDVKAFQVDQPGYYFISQSQIGYDGYVYLYEDPFDLTANPPVTYIAGNDDSPSGAGNSNLDSLLLNPSKTYYLVSTGFDAGEYGDYFTTVTGAGNLLLPGQPDTTEFGFEYLTVNSAGNIVAFSQDLSNPLSYPGSAAGTDYQVCAVSYLKDSVDISPYLNQPFSSLQGGSCLDPSDNCHSVKIFTQPVADAGSDETICFNDTLSLSGNSPGAAQGRWTVIAGSGRFLNSTNPTSKVYDLSVGINMLSWTIDIGGSCTDSDTMEVLVQIPQANAGADDSICRFESTILTASGGVSYSWSNGQNTASISATPISTASYTVTVMDANGCTASDTVTVFVNLLPVVTITNRTICAGSCTIYDAGNPGSTYSWSTGETTQAISVCNAGVACVTVTNATGCSDSDCGVVSIGTSLTVNLNDAAICQDDSVTFDAGNTGATYSWSTGDTTQRITVGAGGVYNVSVVDDNNCSGFDSATVTVLPLPTLSAGNDQSICAGQSATLTATGTGTFTWSTGENTASITVMPAQDSTYNVTLTAGNGCTVSDDVFVEVNPVPNFDLGPNQTICSGESITLTASGGTQYSWNTGQNSASITVSPIIFTIYSVTVTTADNCSASDAVNVNVNLSPIANAGSDVTLCEGESTVLTVSGGGSTYLWSNGNGNSSITVSPTISTPYGVTVTAANGCTGSDSVFVEVNPLPVLELGPDINYCEGTLLTISATGGGTYSWSTGDTTEYIDVMPAVSQTYSVTVTSDDGCVAEDSVAAIVRPNVTANAGPDTTICDGDEITLIASGGPIYQWSTGSNSSITTVSPSDTRVYSVTVSNAFGCEDIDEVTVNVKATPSVTLFGFDTTFYCINHGPIVVAGDPPGGVLQGSGISNGQFVPANAGAGTHLIVYSLTGANGCTGVDSEEITVDLCNGVAGIASPAVIIYPNPADQFIFVNTEGLYDEEAILYLYDPVGKLILNSVMENVEMKIDLASFAHGTYLLQVKHRNGILMKQLVKN